MHRNILTKEGSAQPAQNDVDADAQRDQEDGSIDVHAGERSDHSTTAQQKLTSNKDIGKQGEEYENPMCQGAVTGVNDLQIRVASGSVLLDFAGQDGEHKDLHGGTCSIL